MDWNSNYYIHEIHLRSQMHLSLASSPRFHRSISWSAFCHCCWRARQSYRSFRSSLHPCPVLVLCLRHSKFCGTSLHTDESKLPKVNEYIDTLKAGILDYETTRGAVRDIGYLTWDLKNTWHNSQLCPLHPLYLEWTLHCQSWSIHTQNDLRHMEVAKQGSAKAATPREDRGTQALIMQNNAL